MIKYFSSLKITDYSKSQSENFLNNLMVLSDKDQINLNLKLKSAVIKSKKNTLLRSPHVNKKARDQIKVETFPKFITFDNNQCFHKILNQIIKNNNIYIHMRTTYQEYIFFLIDAKKNIN